MSDETYMWIFAAVLLVPVSIALLGDWLLRRRK
jgi:hypothetical protein